MILVGTASVAGPVNISGQFGTYKLNAKSLKETRWDNVIRQKYDFSCGSAAVATLLTYHYDTPTGEETVFQAMVSKGNKKKIQKQGFSMLDMKKYLDGQGLRADGFRMSLEKFTKIGVPGITLVNTRGYKHFVVVKGIEDDKILVGDPAVGTTVVPRAHFESIWNGAVLAAREQVAVARANFNSKEDWRVRPKAPIGQGVDRSAISSFLLGLPGRNEFGQ